MHYPIPNEIHIFGQNKRFSVLPYSVRYKKSNKTKTCRFYQVPQSVCLYAVQSSCIGHISNHIVYVFYSLLVGNRSLMKDILKTDNKVFHKIDLMNAVCDGCAKEIYDKRKLFKYLTKIRSMNH